MIRRYLKHSVVFWLTVVCIGRLIAQISNDRDYTYTEVTYKDQFDRITGIYESIYIPPVTKYVDGTLITLSPGMFEERFSDFHTEKVNTQLSNAISYHAPKSDYFEREQIAKAMELNIPGEMSHSFDDLKDFMMGTSTVQRHMAFLNNCHNNGRAPLWSYGDKLEKLEPEIKASEIHITNADNAGDLVERLRTRQNFIQKSAQIIPLIEKFSKAGKKWNDSKCAKSLEKLTGNDPWNPDRCNERIKKYREDQQLREQDLSAIRNDISKEVANIEHQMEPNKGQIDAADKTNDYIERLRVRRDILERTAAFATFMGRLAQVTNDNKHIAIAEDYRNHYNHVKGELPAIQKDLENLMDEYKSSFKVFERERSAFNSVMARVRERSKNAELASEDLTKAYKKADKLNRRLSNLKELASKLYFHDERRGFEEIEKTVNEARSKLDEAKKEKEALLANCVGEYHRQREQMHAQESDLCNFLASELLAAEQTGDWFEQINLNQKLIQKYIDTAIAMEGFAHRADEWHKALLSEARQYHPGDYWDPNKIRDRIKDYRNRQGILEEQVRGLEEQIRVEELAFERAGGEYLDLDVDGDQIAWEIRNFEGIFNGQAAPDVDSFDTMMGAFLGEEVSVANEQLLSDFDPSMAGDYAIGSYQYRDEKFAVSIDIRRMAKYMDSGQNFDMFGTESMNLSAIRMVSETGEITFALNGRGEKILIKSDLNSMGNYVAQKTIEGKVYLRTNPEKMLDVDVDKLEIWGVDKKDTNKFRLIASTIADFIPYVGTAKAISELSLGYDYIRGEEVSRVVAVCGIVGTLIPVPGAGKAMKFAGKTVTKIIGNNPNIVSKMIFEKNFNKLFWGFWNDYPKSLINGKEYAKIGDRFYTRHVIDRMKPSALGRAAGGGQGPGRSIAPVYIEEVIKNGQKTEILKDGILRMSHKLGDVEVITEYGGKIVITAMIKK